jgi:hypothetical protein
MNKKEELLELFKKNSDNIIKELEKGRDICIKKNKNGYVLYSNLIKKIKGE